METRFDTVLRQLPDVELQLEVIAEEAAERVDDHHVEGRGLAGSRFDHPLELGAAVIRRRRARLYIGLDKLIAARGAIGFALALLVRDGDIMLGLPRRRDAQVKGGAQRHGHGVCLLLKSSARPKQLIEQVGEPSLEHLDLGLRDGHVVRPVVSNGPGRKVMLPRPAGERPRIAQQRFKLLGRSRGRFSDRRDMSAVSRQADGKLNGP